VKEIPDEMGDKFSASVPEDDDLRLAIVKVNKKVVSTLLV